MRGSAKILGYSLLNLILLSACLGVSWAQIAATISGTVKDETGAVLPGVTTTVKNVATGISRSSVTDDEGRYTIPELAPGNYEVEASLTGFQTIVRSGITLTVGRHAVVDVTLKVGEISEKVTVSGEAPLVETASSALAGLVDDKQIRDLPLNGRNFIQLALLEAGVTHARAAGTSAVVGGGVKMSFHGARADYNSFMMDGTTINSISETTIAGSSGQALGVETIREFQVITSNFSAEFGRGGGGVVNVVTKSGTNEPHGSVFYFHRNDNLDARNFFDPGDPPEFKRNQFGFTAGGPVVKDRTFIFGGYEGLREGLGQTLISRVPTVAARQGIFPNETVAVNPRVRPYLDLYPLPNGRDFGDGTAEVLRGDTEVTDQDFYQARVDHNFSNSDSFFVRYTMDDSSKNTPVSIPNWLQTDVVRAQYVSIEEKRIFSPTVLNVFRFGFNRTRASYTQEALDRRVMDPSLWFFPNNSVPGLGNLGVSGIGEVGGAVNRPRYRLNNVFQWTDTVSQNLSAHSLKMGGEVQRMQNNEAETFRGQGVFTFANLRSFLLAQPTRYVGATADSDWPRGWRQTLMALFAQDDFRVRPNLTLNLGVRWEFITNPSEVNGKSSHISDPIADSREVVGNPLLLAPKNNIAPRIGFAWDPFGDGKTSIRGGAGMFHQMILRYWYFNSGNGLPPFIRLLTQEAPLVSFPNPTGTASAGAPEIDFVEYQNSNVPYMVQYNLSLQRELFPSTVLTLGYVGSQGFHLGRFKDPNIAIPQILPDGRKFFSAGLQRRNPAWGQVRFNTLEANSKYDSLQLKVTRRMRQGLQLQGSYTWSHATDEASDKFAGGFNNTNAFAQDPYDLKSERSHANFDLRHTLVVNFIYDLPLGQNFNGAWGTLLHGWQVNGIANVTSGVPFSAEVTGALDRDRDRGVIVTRPDLVSGHSNNPVLGGPDRYYDASAFRLQDQGFYGNLGRNTLLGPNLTTFDLALVKRLALRGEQRNIQFRAEFFNLLNHANFSLPDRTVFRVASGVASGSAGRISNTVTTSRQLQFGLKVTF